MVSIHKLPVIVRDRPPVSNIDIVACVREALERCVLRFARLARSGIGCDQNELMATASNALGTEVFIQFRFPAKNGIKMRPAGVKLRGKKKFIRFRRINFFLNVFGFN